MRCLTHRSASASVMRSCTLFPGQSRAERGEKGVLSLVVFNPALSGPSVTSSWREVA
jgi:hypothetical protein